MPQVPGQVQEATVPLGLGSGDAHGQVVQASRLSQVSVAGLPGSRAGEGVMRILRCRFCPFEVPFIRKLKSGTLRKGRDTLTWHVREKHPAEYVKIRVFVQRESTSLRKAVVDEE